MASIDPVTAAAVALLASRALESVAAEAGTSAWHGMGRLATLVRNAVAGDSRGESAVKRIETDPNDQEAVRTLAKVLDVHILDDPSLRDELASLVADAKGHPALGQMLTQVYGNARVDKVTQIGIAQGDVSF